MTSISTTYTNAATVDKLQVIRDCDLTSTINKLLALFMQLENNKFIYPELIQAMMLLVRLLSQVEEIAHSYNSKITDATSLTFAAICNDIIINWQ